MTRQVMSKAISLKQLSILSLALTNQFPGHPDDDEIVYSTTSLSKRAIGYNDRWSVRQYEWPEEDYPFVFMFACDPEWVVWGPTHSGDVLHAFRADEGHYLLTFIGFDRHEPQLQEYGGARSAYAALYVEIDQVDSPRLKSGFCYRFKQLSWAAQHQLDDAQAEGGSFETDDTTPFLIPTPEPVEGD